MDFKNPIKEYYQYIVYTLLTIVLLYILLLTSSPKSNNFALYPTQPSKTDTDVLWLRNPFSNLSHNKYIDLQISTDNFNGDQWSEANPINTGFYMIRSNNKTIALFDNWYAKKDNSTGLKEQDVLQNLIREGKFRNLGLKLRFLDTLYFSGFCQNSKDVKAVVTVHSNCCRRISAKMADLTAVIHDWKRFMSATANETLSFQWTPHDNCRNSWRN